jgi:hypothetical protein
MDIIVLITFGIAFVSLYWLAPWGVLALERLGGTRPPDVNFRFRPRDAYSLLERYGPTGVAYWRRLLWMDMVFPLIYIPLLIRLGEPWTKAAGAGIFWKSALIVLPIAAAISDYLEDIFWLRVLAALPKHQDIVVFTASFFTRAKFVLLLGWILVIGAAFLIA